MTGRAFDQLEGDGVRFEHHRAGVLQVFTSVREIGSHVAGLELMAQLGSPSPRYLSAREARALDPALPGAVVGGVLCSGDRHPDPASFVHATADVCIRLGVRFTGGGRIGGLDVRDGHAAAACGAVRLAGRRVHARRRSMVIRSSWPRPVSGAMQASKGYGCDFAPALVQLSHAVYLADHSVGVTPLKRGIRVCGTMEITRLDVSVHRVRRRGRGRRRTVLRRLAAPHPPGSVGQPAADDTGRAALIGLIPGRDNVAIATGHAMLGITLSPVTGYHIARLPLDGTTTP